MLPDFPSVKELRRRRFVRMVDGETEKLTPLVSHICTVRQHEGCQLSYQTVDGVEDVIKYDHRISSGLRIQLDEIAGLEDDYYLSKAKDMARELAPQAMQHFFEMMDRWCNQAGTSFSAGGKPFDPMMYIDALERIDVEFDERGRPKLPTLVVNPKAQASFANKMVEAQRSSEFQRRWNDVITRKWMEWRDREADRKLVE